MCVCVCVCVYAQACTHISRAELINTNLYRNDIASLMAQTVKNLLAMWETQV